MIIQKSIIHWVRRSKFWGPGRKKKKKRGKEEAKAESGRKQDDLLVQRQEKQVRNSRGRNQEISLKNKAWGLNTWGKHVCVIDWWLWVTDVHDGSDWDCDSKHPTTHCLYKEGGAGVRLDRWSYGKTAEDMQITKTSDTNSQFHLVVWLDGWCHMKHRTRRTTMNHLEEKLALMLLTSESQMSSR